MGLPYPALLSPLAGVHHSCWEGKGFGSVVLFFKHYIKCKSDPAPQFFKYLSMM